MNTIRLSIVTLASVMLAQLQILPSQALAKTINTEHYEFSAGSGWNDDEERVIGNIAANLDNIWKQVNDTLENELPPKLKLAIAQGGLASESIREESKVILSAVHIRNRNLRDCLDRVAHETAHIAIHRMSKGKMTKWENTFLDEGIALYMGYLYVGELSELNALSYKIAKEDLQNGQASLTYLRDWEKNVREKQRLFVRNWRKENPQKEPTLEDFIKGGYRTYFTSYSLVKAVVDKHGLTQLLSVVRNIGKGMSQSEAFKMATKQSLDEFISEWHALLT